MYIEGTLLRKRSYKVQVHKYIQCEQNAQVKMIQHSQGSPWVSKISRVSQVHELRTTYRVAILVFPHHPRVGIHCLLGQAYYSDLAVGPTFKLHLITAEASMTVGPVADVAFALFQAFYKGIRLLSLLQCRDSDCCY